MGNSQPKPVSSAVSGRRTTYSGKPLMLLDVEVARCQEALAKVGLDDARGAYLAWRLGKLTIGDIPKQLAGWVSGFGAGPYVLSTLLPPQYSDELVRTVTKSRNPSNWYSIELPTWKRANRSVFQDGDMGSQLNCLTHALQRFPIKDLARETCWVVRASYLAGQRTLPKFENAERELVYIGLINDRVVHFISHKWFGDDPDKDGLVLAYVQSLIKAGRKTEKGIHEDDLIWIDYCCVPQEDQAAKNEQLSKIPFLLNYCQIHIMSDVPGYFASIWCRIEQTTNSAPGPCKDIRAFRITNVQDLKYLMLPLIQFELTRMKMTAFKHLELKEANNFGTRFQVPKIEGRTPTYLDVESLIPNNVLLEIILFSLEC